MGAELLVATLLNTIVLEKQNFIPDYTHCSSFLICLQQWQTKNFSILAIPSYCISRLSISCMLILARLELCLDVEGVVSGQPQDDKHADKDASVDRGWLVDVDVERRRLQGERDDNSEDTLEHRMITKLCCASAPPW